MGRCESERLRSCCGKVLHHIRKELLLVLTILGVSVGFRIGYFVNKIDIKDPEKKATTIMLIGFPGELFMNMLKLLILPLIVASLIPPWPRWTPKPREELVVELYFTTWELC